MPNHYGLDAISNLDEILLQQLLTEAYLNLGWNVRNMHQIDPKYEHGADLEIERDRQKILIAVKAKPQKKDIDQLKRFHQRKSEGKLIYAHSKPATGAFAEEANALGEDVQFLMGADLHDFLIEGESITYLRRVFEQHPLLKEYSDALAQIWSSRHTAIPDVTTNLDVNNLMKLKDAVVKKRSAVSVFAMKYHTFIDSLLSKRTDSFPKLLQNVLDDLDIVQRYAGMSLYSTMSYISETTPYLLARLWRLVSERTFWGEYTAITERFSEKDRVSSFTRRYWILPSINSIGEAGIIGGHEIGFLTGLRDILDSLARSFGDLDLAIDWTWNHTMNNERD